MWTAEEIVTRARRLHRLRQLEQMANGPSLSQRKAWRDRVADKESWGWIVFAGLVAAFVGRVVMEVSK